MLRHRASLSALRRLRASNSRSRSITVNRRTALLAVVIIATSAVAACTGDPVTRKQQHYAKGTGYLADGKYNEAVLEFRSALQIDPAFADAHHRLGLAYWRKGWIPDARFELEAAVQLGPDR